MAIAVVFIFLIGLTLAVVVTSSLNPLHRRVMQTFSKIDQEVKMRLDLNNEIIRISKEIKKETKADRPENVEKLLHELAELDGKISFSKQAFNDAVIDYNSQREKILYRILDRVLRFPDANLLSPDDESRSTVFDQVRRQV